MGPKLTTAVALGVAGVVLVNLGAPTGGAGENAVLGLVLVFGAVCAEATFTLLGKKLTADLDMIEISTAAAVGALVLFAIPAGVQAVSFDWSQVDLSVWGCSRLVGARDDGPGLGHVVRGCASRTRRCCLGVHGRYPGQRPRLVLLPARRGISPWHLLGMGAVLAGIGLVAWRERERD